MVNDFLVRPTGKFPGQTEILKRLPRFPDWDVPNGNSFTIYEFLEFRTSFKRVSMGLTDMRKTAKNLVVSRKN